MKRKQHLQGLAEETLGTFAEIANEAVQKLSGLWNGSPETMAGINTWTETRTRDSFVSYWL